MIPMRTLLYVTVALVALSSPFATGDAAPAPAVEPAGKGWVDAGTFANLSAAKSSPATAGKTIVISSPQKVNNLTIPRDRPIRVEPGGNVTVAAGRKVTINGPFDAGRYRVFAGQGRVSLGETNWSLTPVVFPQWWGIVADDLATEDTADFQKMLNDIGPAGQAVIDLGEGVYSLKTLDLTGFQGGIHFRGAGVVKTSIRYVDGTSTLFNLTNSRFNRFTDMAFLPHGGAPRTAGAVFYLGANSSGNTFENIRMASPYDGFYLYKSSGNVFRNIDGLDYANHSWHTMFTLEGNSASNWFYKCGLTTQQRAYAVFDIKKAADATGVDTVVISECYGQKRGTQYIDYGIKAGFGEFLHAKNNFFELGSAGGVGISLEGMNNVSLTDNHLVTNKYGLHIIKGDNITVSGGRIYRNGRNGLRLDGGSYVNISGVAFMDNGFTATKTYDQVYVAPGVSHFSLSGNTIGKIRHDKLLSRYGIFLADGASDHYTISGNIIGNYASGDVYDGGRSAGDKLVSSRDENKSRVNAHIRTGDAGGKILWRRSLPHHGIAMVSAKVLARGAGGTVRNAYLRTTLVYREEGDALMQGVVQDNGTIESSLGSDCTFTVSGDEVRLLVTGEIGKNIDWYANVELLDVMETNAIAPLPSKVR